MLKQRILTALVLLPLMIGMLFFAGERLWAAFAGLTAGDVGEALLSETDERLRALSEAVSLRYFLPIERADGKGGGQFLA